MFFKTHCFYFSTVTGDINRPLELDGTCIKRTAVSFISSMHLVASVAVRTGIPVSWCSLSSYHPQTPSNSNRLVSAFWHRIRYFPKDQTVTFSSKRKWGERNNNNKTNWSLLRPCGTLWNNLGGKKQIFPSLVWPVMFRPISIYSMCKCWKGVVFANLHICALPHVTCLHHI